MEDPNPRTPTKTMVRAVYHFAASPEQVFDAWLDPKWLDRWMFGRAIRDEEIVHLKTDPRVGGTFSFKVRRGGQEIDHIGTYRQIERPRLLVFTWGVVGESEDESVLTVEISPKDGGSELNLLHELDPKWADFAKRTQESWAKMLNALDKALAQGSRERP
jgi:uncharacterized protein YndB with AHSA1/START domain